MLSKTLLTLGALFLLSVVATNVFASPLQDQVFEPSVQIGADGKGFCSGEIISSERDAISGDVSTIILTAKHCVKDDPKDTIYQIMKAKYDEKNRKVGVDVYLAEVLGQSYKSDLALIRLRDKDTLFIKTATVAPRDTKLEFSQKVSVIGYPVGGSMTYTDGYLGFVEDGFFKDISTSGQFYRATPDTAPGSSGSSMFTQNKTGAYEIIGTLTGGMRGFSYINLYTPIEEINDYLDVAKGTFAWPAKAQDGKSASKL